jgi:hypothetical protein
MGVVRSSCPPTSRLPSSPRPVSRRLVPRPPSPVSRRPVVGRRYSEAEGDFDQSVVGVRPGHGHEHGATGTGHRAQGTGHGATGTGHRATGHGESGQSQRWLKWPRPMPISNHWNEDVLSVDGFAISMIYTGAKSSVDESREPGQPGRGCSPQGDGGGGVELSPRKANGNGASGYPHCQWIFCRSC